jgi:hypothetical protein
MTESESGYFYEPVRRKQTLTEALTEIPVIVRLCTFSDRQALALVQCFE